MGGGGGGLGEGGIREGRSMRGGSERRGGGGRWFKRGGERGRRPEMEGRKFIADLNAATQECSRMNLNRYAGRTVTHYS